LKTFSFNDACNLFLFSKPNTKTSFFSEIKTYLILIGLSLGFICFAYLSSVSFLFSWISSAFSCYLLKYRISHELVPRLSHGSFCCCPLVCHGQPVDHTCTLLTACVIRILNRDQLKTAAQPKSPPSDSGPWLVQCIKSRCSQGKRMEGGKEEESREHPLAHHALGEASLSVVYVGSLRQTGTAPKLGKGKGFGHPPNNLVLKQQMETERYEGPRTVNEIVIWVCIIHAWLCTSVHLLFLAAKWQQNKAKITSNTFLKLLHCFSM